MFSAPMTFSAIATTLKAEIAAKRVSWPRHEGVAGAGAGAGADAPPEGVEVIQGGASTAGGGAGGAGEGDGSGPVRRGRGGSGSGGGSKQSRAAAAAAARANENLPGFHDAKLTAILTALMQSPKVRRSVNMCKYVRISVNIRDNDDDDDTWHLLLAIVAIIGCYCNRLCQPYMSNTHPPLHLSGTRGGGARWGSVSRRSSSL